MVTCFQLWQRLSHGPAGALSQNLATLTPEVP